MKPLISIIVPVYNVEQHIETCLESLLNQNLSPIEIICVNDGSPDNSEEIIKELQLSNKCIRLINQTNQGLSVARNTGINNAEGEFILFVDSDDFLEPNVLKELYNTSNKHNLDILDFGVYSYRDNIQKAWNEITPHFEEPVSGEQYFSSLIKRYKKQPNVSAWSHLFKTELIKNNILFFIPERYYEDLSFTAEAYLLSQRVYYTKTFVYNYRSNPNSITRTNVSQKQINDLIFMAGAIKKISSKYKIEIPMDNFFSAIRKKITVLILSEKETKLDQFLFPNIFSKVEFNLLHNKNRLLYQLFKYKPILYIYFSIIKLLTPFNR